MGEALSACGALWPAPPCGWRGQCDEAAGVCVCEEGWQLSPLVVDGAALCNIPDGLLPAALASSAAVLVCFVVLAAARIGLDWRAGRLRDRLDLADNALELGFCFSYLIAYTLCNMKNLPYQVDPAASAMIFFGSMFVVLRQKSRNERMARAAQCEQGVRVGEADPAATSKLFEVLLLLAVVAGFASHVCFFAGLIAPDTNTRVCAVCQVSSSIASMLSMQR
jgi:hypothetical protein